MRLFIVTRHRRNLRRGIGLHESIVTSMDTSGRAVLFAATTVCIALLGLLALGVSFFNGMAIGAAVAVSLTAAASLTLLPALLSLFGLKVLPRKQRRAVRAGEFIEPHATGFWAGWSVTVSRHKTLLSLGAAAVIVILAAPFFSMRLGAGDQGNDPKGSTTRSGYDLIAHGFRCRLQLHARGCRRRPWRDRSRVLAEGVHRPAGHDRRRPDERARDPAEQRGRVCVLQVDDVSTGREDLRAGEDTARAHPAAGL